MKEAGKDETTGAAAAKGKRKEFMREVLKTDFFFLLDANRGRAKKKKKKSLSFRTSHLVKCEVSYC